MKKYMKLALDREQLSIKKHYERFSGYEIHLLGNDKDDFSIVDEIDKDIITFHYPIERCDVYDVASEVNRSYFKTVLDLCKKRNAGLVIHAETGLDRLLTNPNLDTFCKVIKESGVNIHIENCYRYVGAIEGLKIIGYLKKEIGSDQVFPLLDTCHLIMSEMSFKFKEMSFFDTIDSYRSENMIIHLNDCMGSGENESGGKHGTNFYANQYLLRNILWKLSEMDCKHIKLVLEVTESDYCYPTNADMLAKNIIKIEKEFNIE